MQKIKYLISIVTLSIFLSGCGGGGDGSSTPVTPPPPVNNAPTADAGLEQGVDEDTVVTLTGSGSDSDGTIASYAWTQTSGPSVSLTDANTATATFTAPNTGSDSSVVFTFTLTVTDNDGATGDDGTVVTVNTTNVDPVANAGPNLTVDEQSLVTLDGSSSMDSDGNIASYDWLQTGGSGVSISDSAAVSPTFDAPSLSAPETLEFTLTVTDDRGFTSTDTVTITVNNVAALNEAPLADAGQAQTVASGDSVTLDGSLSTDSDGSITSYAWVQSGGMPGVTLTGADTATPSFTAPTVTADTVLTFTLTVTDNEGATADNFVEITVTPPPANVTISGKVTYDNVPHNSNSSLNYTNITQDPVRQAVIELLTGTTVMQSDLTDNNGDYSFEVDPNSGTYSIRVKAQALLNDVATWDTKVVDNTNSQALYALDSSTFSAASSNITLNLNAPSGWNGTSYSAPRAAAPFHILDRVVDGLLKIQSVDPDVVFAPVDINWSPNNNLTGSNTSSSAAYLASLRSGDVGTSFFTSFPVIVPSEFEEFEGSQMFILGSANSDTDEYDGHIIVHEWGHYFENNLSRSDSIGGAHTSSDRLDMRLAFGEGFGNAWSGIITDDTFYRDSFGTSQSQGFSINVESNSTTNEGWYNERSVQSILYDVYDSASDGDDTLSLGLQPIYDVLVGPQKTTEAFTSIYSFSEYFRQANASSVSGYNMLLAGQSIDGTGIYGTGESNDAGAVPSSNVLPVYTELTVGGGSKQVCSIDDYDSVGSTAESGNKLSNMRFVRFNIPSTGNYSFLISAAATQDPDMEIYLQGQSVAFAAPGGDGDPGDAGDSTFPLTAGNYVAEAYEFDNTFRGNTANSSDECFTVEIISAP